MTILMGLEDKEFGSKLQIMGHLRSCSKHPEKDKHDAAYKQAGNTCSKFYKEHPEKTWLGKHHTTKTKEKLSQIRAKTLETECLDKPFCHVKWHKVMNLEGVEYSVRGHWEENVALQLNKLGILWVKAKPIKYFDEYEHRYTADLFIPSMNIYVEVKGRYPEEDRKKMRLVHTQHPEIKIYFIDAARYHCFIQGKLDFNDDLLLSEKDL